MNHQLNTTWIEILLKSIAAAEGMKQQHYSKHAKGTTGPHNAAKLRKQRNKRERQARKRS